LHQDGETTRGHCDYYIVIMVEKNLNLDDIDLKEFNTKRFNKKRAIDSINNIIYKNPNIQRYFVYEIFGGL
jgi:hypothetical protein